MSEFYGLSADEVGADWMTDAIDRVQEPGDVTDMFQSMPELVEDFLERQKPGLSFVLDSAIIEERKNDKSNS